MKQDTQDMKPLRKLLKGKVPTRQQYTNWITPVRNTYNKYASIIFSFLGVFFVYSDQNLYNTVNAVIFINLDTEYYKNEIFENFSCIHAWQAPAMTRLHIYCTERNLSVLHEPAKKNRYVV